MSPQTAGWVTNNVDPDSIGGEYFPFRVLIFQTELDVKEK